MTEHNHDSNINESIINENPEDQQASDETAAGSRDSTDDIETAPGEDRLTPEKLGEAARKVATETAYAAAGFAGFVGERAKAFYDEQRKQYAEAHPDEDAPKAKAFLDQLSDQLNKFAEELNRSYKEMAERGRNVVQGSAAKAKPDEASNESETDFVSASDANDGESATTGQGPTFSSNLADDVSETGPRYEDVVTDPEKQDGIL